MEVDTQNYLVSVITPVYNAESTLDKVIECVQQQSLRSIEHILIDDGSTDCSPEIISSYEKNMRMKSFKTSKFRCRHC